MHRCPTQSIATTNTTQQLRATRPARAPVVAPQRSADRPASNHPSQFAPHRSAACPGSIATPDPRSSAAAIDLRWWDIQLLGRILYSSRRSRREQGHRKWRRKSKKGIFVFFAVKICLDNWIEDFSIRSKIVRSDRKKMEIQTYESER